VALVFFSIVGQLATLAAAKSQPPGSAQGKEKRSPELFWNPPEVDSPQQSHSATPPCSLPDVLRQAGQRAEELVDHLQNFIAHEQVRYSQTDRQGMPQKFLIGKFDYVVDFGEQAGPLTVHESRTALDGTDVAHLSSIVDKGLPALALIFYPALRSDYEMSCEGSTRWNDRPAWVVHFRQIKDKLPRTATMETTKQAYPYGLKGRAWIAADSGQVMHLETNLVEKIPLIDLQANAVSVDYAPVRFQSQNVEIWLPQFAMAYTDYAKRRMITEHIFSDFQLFSVQTQENIQKPKEP
jgi:hypothetical protein